MTRPAARRRSPSPDLVSPAELRGARPARQARSVEALQRIAAAARDLLAQRGYANVTVADIASVAGVAAGTVYARFPSKEHLLVHLLANVVDEILESVEKDLRPERWTDATLEDLIAFYVREMVRAFTQHRWILQPATMIARQSTDASLLALLTQTNGRIHGAFRALLLTHADEIARPDPEVAVDVMILTISAALRETVLYAEPVSRLSPGRERLPRELTRMALTYLRVANELV